MTKFFKNSINKLVRKFSPSLTERQFYSGILSKHLLYYNELNSLEKERFVDRVILFKKNKKFICIGLDEKPEMSVLISAAAIQLSFGLPHFRMKFFSRIYITADAYTYGFSNQPWEGHVNSHGIYISWKHFLQGYYNNTDNSNTGLHEMAHAMQRCYVIEEPERHPHFSRHFALLRFIIGGALLQEEFQVSGLFSNQGIKSYEECWAECIELFFENPIPLQKKYPELYSSISKLLNQDPINKINIIDTFLAG